VSKILDAGDHVIIVFSPPLYIFLFLPINDELRKDSLVISLPIRFNQYALPWSVKPAFFAACLPNEHKRPLFFLRANYTCSLTTYLSSNDLVLHLVNCEASYNL
jgi:hypothetical protein